MLKVPAYTLEPFFYGEPELAQGMPIVPRRAVPMPSSLPSPLLHPVHCHVHIRPPVLVVSETITL